MFYTQRLTALFFLVPLLLIGQSQEKTQFAPLFQSIERLIDKHLMNNQQYFDAQNLIAKKDESSGTDQIDYCFDLYVHYIYKSTELAKQAA